MNVHCRSFVLRLAVLDPIARMAPACTFRGVNMRLVAGSRSHAHWLRDRHYMTALIPFGLVVPQEHVAMLFSPSARKRLVAILSFAHTFLIVACPLLISHAGTRKVTFHTTL